LVVCLLCLVSTARAYGQDGTVERTNYYPFRVELVGEITIDAPLEVVWEVLVDSTAYEEWNPAILAVEPGDADLTAEGERRRLVLPGRWGSRKQWVVIHHARAPGPADEADPAYDHNGHHVAASWSYSTDDLAARWNWYSVSRGHQLWTTDEGLTRLEIVESFQGFLWTAPMGLSQDVLEDFLEALRERAEIVHHLGER
jgi:hypothetical protein